MCLHTSFHLLLLRNMANQSKFLSFSMLKFRRNGTPIFYTPCCAIRSREELGSNASGKFTTPVLKKKIYITQVDKVTKLRAQQELLLIKRALGYKKSLLLLKLTFSNKKNKKLNKPYPKVMWQKATFSRLA